MTQYDVTAWYDPDQNPARTGYYQRDYGNPLDIAVPDYWDGLKWITCNVYGRAICRVGVRLPWRGLRRQA